MPRTKLTMRNTIPAKLRVYQPNISVKMWEGVIEDIGGGIQVFDPDNKMRPYYHVLRPVFRFGTQGRGKHLLIRYVVSDNRRKQSTHYKTLKEARDAAVRYAARKFRIKPRAYERWDEGE
jgi:hypothetical protein